MPASVAEHHRAGLSLIFGIAANTTATSAAIIAQSVARNTACVDVEAMCEELKQLAKVGAAPCPQAKRRYLSGLKIDKIAGLKGTLLSTLKQPLRVAGPADHTIPTAFPGLSPGKSATEVILLRSAKRQHRRLER